jgi:hypothetical protein
LHNFFIFFFLFVDICIDKITLILCLFQIGYEDQVYNDLKNASSRFPMEVYNLKNTPSRWHITNSRRAPPIIVVANEGYAFQDLKQSIEYYTKEFHFKRK